jgi:hypothetical protein
MAKKAPKATKKMTLQEFKAWLEGIEEVQPANWHPTIDQWKLIRDRIEHIVIAETPAPQVQYVQQQQPQQQFHQPEQVRRPPSSLDAAFAGNSVIQPEPFIPKQPVDVLGRPIQNNGSVGGLVATDSGALKTPDIQSTTYHTSFE